MTSIIHPAQNVNTRYDGSFWCKESRGMKSKQCRPVNGRRTLTYSSSLATDMKTLISKFSLQSSANRHLWIKTIQAAAAITSTPLIGIVGEGVPALTWLEAAATAAPVFDGAEDFRVFPLTLLPLVGVALA